MESVEPRAGVPESKGTLEPSVKGIEFKVKGLAVQGLGFRG